MTRLYHAFQDANTFWLVMELGQGGDLLERLLSEGKAMTEQAVCSSVAIPILETLAVLHDMFIIHRYGLQAAAGCAGACITAACSLEAAAAAAAAVCQRLARIGDVAAQQLAQQQLTRLSAGQAQDQATLCCRDLKLENIFLNADGTVLLGDFGLTMSSKQELAISPVGTVEYMAPEVSSSWLPG